MKLTSKAELAMIARLKQHAVFANVTFKQQATEAPKRYGDIVVACKQVSENSPPSGVYDLEMEITLLYPVRLPAGDSVTDYEAKCNALEEVLNTWWLQLAKELTATRTDWHCYDVKLTGTDNAPTEKAHKSVYSCTLIAMGYNFATAEKLRPRLS